MELSNRKEVISAAKDSFMNLSAEEIKSLIINIDNDTKESTTRAAGLRLTALLDALDEKIGTEKFNHFLRNLSTSLPR